MSEKLLFCEIDYLHSAGGKDVAILVSHNMYLVDALRFCPLIS